MWSSLNQLAKYDTAGVGCCLLAFVLYYNTLDADFVYDDSRAILRNPDVLSSTPISDLWRNDFWGTTLNSSESHGSYRPLCVLTFRLNHWLGGFRPRGFHLTNVLLHVLNTALVLRVARLLLPRSSTTMAAMLFSAHPIHTEAVSGVVGRGDLLACLFYLLSFLAYLHHISLRDKSTRSNKINKFCEVQTSTKCLLVFNEVLGYLRLCSSPFGLKHLPYSSTAARQCACLALCLVFAAMAMLSKETGLTVLLVCAIYDVIRSARAWPGAVSLAVSLSTLAVGLGGMMMFRLYLMGPHTPTFATADNPTARCPWLLTRLLTFLYLPVFNLYLLLYPRWLSFDWSMDAIPRITSLTDPRNMVVFVAYYFIYKSVRLAFEKVFTKHNVETEFSILKCNRVSSKSRGCSTCKHPLSDSHSVTCRTNNNNNHVSKCECKHSFVNSVTHRTLSETFLVSFVFLVVPFLPATNVLFYVGFVVAERVLYLPSVGYCFIVALGGHVLSRRCNRRLLRVVFLLMLLAFSGRTIRRNRNWKDEESLYRSGISINPPKAYGNLGSVLSSQGRTEEAEKAFNLALKYRPNMADVHYNLGNLLQSQGKYEDAIRSYHNAIQCRPSLALAHLKLGQLLASRGRCDEAERVFRRCATLDVTGLKDPRQHEDTKMAALLHLGRLHADRGQHQEAVQAYLQAVDTRPLHYQPQVLYNLLGESLSRLGRHEEAEAWYRAALEAKPDHVPAHITYGKHLARNKTRMPEAEQWFLKAQKLAPSDPVVYQQYGELLSSQDRHEEAARQMTRAAELSPLSYELILGAATALRQAGRYSKAELYYRRAVNIRPKDPTSHSNLGAMLHLSGKLTEAAASYREALRLEPSDVTTLTNLHKLRHLMARIET
ncbi:protein O-mannosyl-transferase TMTC2 [Macrosteles quadrilineatus]|uniref:protein O-mannosyl-transferase TMTC2 n=1 Tax=Macrosteles quadrilineatus TaxID=74068 RepID=UPI0023E2355B|nr:protein O-mannosyl-transferase TMTC2 [Macrosteles quadrilineatus]